MRDYTRMGRSCLAVLLLTTIAACSTTYQEAHRSFLVDRPSGYQEEKAAGGLIKVTYNGSRFHMMSQMEDYTLYRCAEIAKREGSPYFALYQTLPDALQDRRSATVRPTTLLGIPHAQVYLRPYPSAAPGLLSSAEVLARLTPAIVAGGK